MDAAARMAEAERRADPETLGELIAPDYQGYDPSGRSQDRAGVLGAYSTGGVRLTHLQRSDVRVKIVGEAGLVAGISVLQGERSTEHFAFRLRFLDVYAWRDGRWQLVASQDTRLPG